MILSRDRILTTHVGSLPRSEALSELLIDREEGKPVDERQLADEMDRAVRQVIAKQAEAGIDVGNDGEQQRVGFQTYVPRRMSGFAGESKRRRGRDFEEFPALVEDLMRRFPKRSRMQNAPRRSPSCTISMRPRSRRRSPGFRRMPRPRALSPSPL